MLRNGRPWNESIWSGCWLLPESPARWGAGSVRRGYRGSISRGEGGPGGRLPGENRRLKGKLTRRRVVVRSKDKTHGKKINFTDLPGLLHLRKAQGAAAA